MSLALASLPPATPLAGVQSESCPPADPGRPVTRLEAYDATTGIAIPLFAARLDPPGCWLRFEWESARVVPILESGTRRAFVSAPGYRDTMLVIAPADSTRAATIRFALRWADAAWPPVRAFRGLPRDHWPELYFPQMDSAYAVMGLAPLRATILPPGDAEVRFWTRGELTIPIHLYRMSITGERVTGERYTYWPAREPPATDDSSFYHHPDCGRFARGSAFVTCQSEFDPEPDWDGVLESAERAGLWTLPDPSVLPQDVLVLDGWSMIVELRDGDSYRTYKYSSPEIHRWPEADSAKRIAEVITAVDSLIRRTDGTRSYRGSLEPGPRRGGRFTPCGVDGETWWIPAYYMEPLRAAFDAGDSGEPAPLYVEITAALMPGERWSHGLTRALTEVDVQVRAPWEPHRCDRAKRSPARTRTLSEDDSGPGGR